MPIKKGKALFTGFIDKYLIEETAVLNVLTDPRKTMGVTAVVVRYRTRENDSGL
jgi:hypothetical protein